RDVVAAMARGETLECGRGTLATSATAALAGLLPENIEEVELRRTSADSSNYTVLVGDNLFLKAYRRLRRGLHPEWELGRFLTERSPCKAVVPTAGAVELVEDGVPTTVLLVQAAVANQGDGWRFALQYLERAIDDAVTRGADGSVAPVDHEGVLLLVRALA